MGTGGYALVLDKGGSIKEILKKGPIELEKDHLLHRYIVPWERDFLWAYLRQEGQYPQEDLTFTHKGDPLPHKIASSFLKDGSLFMLLFQDEEDLLEIYEAMIQEKSIYLPPLREILKKRLWPEKKKEKEEHLYNQISALNNDLINLQRSLTKKNKTLDTYSKEREQLYQKLQKTLDRIEKDYEKGKRLHACFFPATFPSIPGFSFASYYQPAFGIGGDFFHIIPQGDETLIYLADASGHGLDGAMINIFLRGAIDSFLLSPIKSGGLSPRALLRHIYDQFVREDFPQELYLCLLLLVLNQKEMTIHYCNAGFQIPPFLLREGTVFTPINRGMPISRIISDLLRDDGVSPFYQEKKIEILSPSTLLLTTDGMVEQRNERDFYGIERIKEVLAREGGGSPQKLKEALIKDLLHFSGSQKAQDDITFLIIKRTED